MVPGHSYPKPCKCCNNGQQTCITSPCSHTVPCESAPPRVRDHQAFYTGSNLRDGRYLTVAVFTYREARAILARVGLLALTKPEPPPVLAPVKAQPKSPRPVERRAARWLAVVARGAL